MYFEMYENATGDWRWRVRANNNCLIAWSGESYNDKIDCLHAIDLLKTAPIYDPVPELVQEAVRRAVGQAALGWTGKPMLKAG